MTSPQHPPVTGLYDPTAEHDACGVAFVATLRGTPGRDIVDAALTALANLDHRGAVGAEADTGDGAGILTQIPDAFLRDVIDADLPAPGRYAVGLVFLPTEADALTDAVVGVEKIVRDEGLDVLAWRDVPVTAAMRDALSPADLSAGWRLACLAEADAPVTLEIAQWSPRILDDQTDVPFEPGEGTGVVVDVGTTTLVAQAVDLETGRVLQVATALNPQARFGADLMTRLHAESVEPGVQTRLVRAAVGELVSRVVGAGEVCDAVLGATP